MYKRNYVTLTQTVKQNNKTSTYQSITQAHKLNITDIIEATCLFLLDPIALTLPSLQSTTMVRLLVTYRLSMVLPQNKQCLFLFLKFIKVNSCSQIRITLYESLSAYLHQNVVSPQEQGLSAVLFNIVSEVATAGSGTWEKLSKYV